MTSATSTSWEKELRKNICTNFGRGIMVNGENSGRTKLLYIYNKGLGSAKKESLKPYTSRRRFQFLSKKCSRRRIITF